MGEGDDDPNGEARARAAAEREETEALLASFDRPARTPRTPPVKRDFVEYFKKNVEKSAKDPAPPPKMPSGERRERHERARATFVIPRTRLSVPTWLGWAALLVAMPVAGAFVAFFAVRTTGAPVTGAPSEPSARTPVPSAATTIWSATTAPPVVPPAPSTPPAPVAPPPAKSDGRSDFIREL